MVYKLLFNVQFVNYLKIKRSD